MTGGLREALCAVFEDFNGGLIGAMEQKFTGPDEEVFFAGVHVCGGGELVGGVEIFAFGFVDATQQVVDLAGVVRGAQRFCGLTGFGQFACEQSGEGEIVAVLVGRGTCVLRGFKQGHRFRDAVLADAEFAEVVVRVVVAGIELKSLL